MVEHVYRRAAQARGVDAVVVATDDERIAEAVERFGGVVRMTDRSHPTGTDRIAEIAGLLDCEILLNVQGDLPLIEPGKIEEVLGPLASDPTLEMSTLRKAITDASDYTNPNVVKVVVDRASNALYFSRAAIPFVRGSGTTYKHIGLYAYRRSFVKSARGAPADAARDRGITRTTARPGARLPDPRRRNMFRIDRSGHPRGPGARAPPHGGDRADVRRHDRAA